MDQILQATFTIFSLILILLAYHHISLTPKQPITDSPRSPTHKVHTPYTASCDTIPISVPLHTYVQHSYTHTRFPPQSSCSCLHSSSTINLGKIKDPILPRIGTRTPPDVEPSHPYPVTVGFNPPPARTPPRPATPPNLWPPISIPSPTPIYVPHEHDHDHEHEHEHEHDFTDLRDPFAPRAHLVSPPTSLPTRASHPPLTHPLTPHTRTRTGTRMSTWGRLQFPVRSPSNLSLPPFVPDLHADPASPSGNFVPRMRTNNTGKTVFKPKPISASSIRGAHAHTSPSPSPSRTGKNLKVGKGRGLKRGGSRRVKVCVLEEIDSDIDGEVEDSALLAQRLLKRLQRQV
ncbi:hypothetical protein L208DRAFT_1397740 [Tricholoma matsutake]|nr:hypothetical protein L208DRAFT_1397740 [Tricholoma matsutake 945]